MPQHPVKILISGGGTGGHLFPALAVADKLREKIPHVEILLVGARGKMEMKRVPEAGYPIKGLWISGLQRRMTFKNLLFPLKLLHSMLKVRRIIIKFKPDVVAGFGGFASGPALKMAMLRKLPTLIQEQNSFPGVTNRLLAKKVDKICVAYEGMEKYFPGNKIILTGNPVREFLYNLTGKKGQGLEFFGLKKNIPVLLIIGGSQGANSINTAIQKNINIMMRQEIQVIWQTGIDYYGQAIEAVKGWSDKIRVFDFIKPMDYAYAVADLVVSRAGAIAISELCITGKASILIPLPTAAEDHQTKNAQALAAKNAAILVKDQDAPETLGGRIVDLMSNKHEREKLEKNIIKLAKPESTDQIAAEIIGLVKNNQPS